MMCEHYERLQNPISSFNLLPEVNKEQISLFFKNRNTILSGVDQIYKNANPQKKLLENSYKMIRASITPFLRGISSNQSSYFASYFPNSYILNDSIKQNIKLATSYNHIANLIGSIDKQITPDQQTNFEKLLAQQSFENFYKQISYPIERITHDSYQHGQALDSSKIISKHVRRNPSNNSQRNYVVRKQLTENFEDVIEEAKHSAENISDNETSSADISFDVTIFWVYISSVFSFISKVQGDYEAIQFLIGLFNWIINLLGF
ncbi:hypothetical protein [Levilactobacillus brevis]|uniref:hypothetical protein n=1 Tax=Levilactobacillus brevis TaxID=1580 RepID=UPI001F450CDE|nr:hypothetical protein [Levilactobacillus brevis]MCE6022555.1 hypothetical protein [Levilactobacillus brevis]